MTLDVKAISDSMEGGKVKEQNRVPEKIFVCRKKIVLKVTQCYLKITLKHSK